MDAAPRRNDDVPMFETDGTSDDDARDTATTAPVAAPELVGPPDRPSGVIVDDAPSCRRVMRELLERRGYRVAGEAGCVASALDLVARLEPDAALLDVHLRDENGFELAALLNVRHPKIAVLLTSVDFGSSFFARAEASGARGFVPKDRLAEVEFTIFWPGATPS
jgi:CheY-like chemotaxis protein